MSFGSDELLDMPWSIVRFWIKALDELDKTRR